jgi:glycosyltransferase involved in cell wall biosynthesis
MIDPSANPRITLAHDWLVGLRGGEYVLDRLARLFGPTDLHTLVHNGRPMTDAIDACRIRTSFLHRLPGGSGRLRRHLLPLMPAAVDRLRVDPCDLLISTSSAVMKSIRPPAGTPHLCYCHSPARYLWEQTEDYALGAGGRLRKTGLALFGRRLRRWDRRTADRVTRFLANSAHTAARIKRCYDRDAIVIHPPVRTDFFTIDHAAERENWLLIVSALEPYKRTELAIAAASRAGLPLKVVGDGSQFKSLRRSAGPSVDMLGRVDDETLRDLYRRARALIFPQVEDFGLVPVEAQAAGCPVIAFAGGGALESVTDRTGVFFTDHSIDAVLGAVDALDGRTIDPQACRANAERFSEARFDRAMLDQVNEMLGDDGQD